jgi:hypothetical protein
VAAEQQESVIAGVVRESGRMEVLSSTQQLSPIQRLAIAAGLTVSVVDSRSLLPYPSPRQTNV